MRHALVVVASLLGLSLACTDGEGGDAGPVELDDDAGVADAGPVYEGPQVEVEEGFFDDDTLARAPWRCDAPPHRWWGVSSLGDVLERQEKGTFSQALLSGFKQQLAAQIVLARDPAYSVVLHRIRYQTQDRGVLVDATGLVAVPDAPNEALPIVLFLHGTEGYVDDCSPSDGIDTFTQPNYPDAATLAMFASWGYVVVAPDYLGLKSFGPQSTELHPYLIAEPTALVSLDAVRAAKKLMTELGAQGGAPAPDGPLVVLGVSQGGHGAGFVARYQPHYAKDLPITAVVAAVPPLDLVGESEAARENSSSTKRGSSGAFLATGGIWYRSASPIGDAVLAPFDVDLLDQLYTVCNVPSLGGDVESVFSPALLDGTLMPYACFGAENALPSTSIPRREEAPMLMVLAENDALVSREAERAAFVTLCDQGMALELKECANSSHIEGFTYAIDDAFDWLDARIAGAPLDALCEATQPVTCSSDPR